MSLKNIRILRMKFWINLIKISKKLAIRKSNIGMKRISSESKKMNSTINTMTLLSNTANTNISFKISNGWLKWKKNFKKPKMKDKSKKKIMKRELLLERQEKRRKRERRKNMLRRKRKMPREKLKKKRMLSKMRDKMKSKLWIKLMLLSTIPVSVQILWPPKLNNVMLF